MEEEKKTFIVVHEQILARSELSLSEAIVLSRIASFSRYYESKEHLSEFMFGRICPRVCMRIKQKLERLGFIEVVENTGRGKVYRFNFELFGMKEPETKSNEEVERFASSLAKNAPESADESDLNDAPYNKVERKGLDIKENIDSKESILAQRADDGCEEEQQEFGNADINEAFKLWEDATGFDLSANKFERRAMFNLLRRKDVKAHGGFKALVTLVKDARRIDSRFAPKIAKPSELGGKYSKYERLIDWSKTREQKQTPSNTYHHEQDTSIIGTYYKPHPEVATERYEEPRFMTAEEREQERLESHEFCETFRDKVFGSIAKNKKKHEEESREWKKKRLNGIRF